MRSVTVTDTAATSLFRRRSSRIACFRTAVVGLVLFCAVGARGEPLLATRLRLTIDSPQPDALRGELSASAGALEKLQALSLIASSAAGCSLDGAVVRLHHAGAINKDAFDVTVRCPPDATLRLRLEGENPIEASVAVGEARASTSEAPLVIPVGDRGVTLSVTRLPADRLRVESSRTSLLFKPGERFAFNVTADPPGIARGEPFDFVATLSRGRGETEIWRSEQQRLELGVTGVATAAIEAPLPLDEGVYQLKLTASKPSGFRSRFLPSTPLLHGADAPLAERTFQVAVFDPDRRPRRPGDWQETYAFDPRSPGWVERLPNRMRWRRLPWFASAPRSSEDHVDTANNGAIEIAASPGEGRVHWRAYPLPIDQPGTAYAVEVETLGAPGEAITVAVLEPDALGDLRPITTAVTHLTPRWNRSAERPPLRLFVSPKTAAPLLVLSNPSEKSVARFGKVRLLKSRSVEASAPAGERVVALDWSDADLPHAVGASHVKSAIGPFEQPDLLTYWETANGLADRVESAGAGAALIDVNQAGAAIYPSRWWGSPRYDLSTWSDGAADLPRRELLSLVEQEFGRRGLKLLPSVRFDAPCTAIESRPQSSYDAGSESARVAQRLVVGELLDAIGTSKSIAGVAVRLTPEGWGAHHPLNPDRATQNEPLVAAYEELAKFAADGTSTSLPLLLLPAELTKQPELQRSLLPRLGSGNATTQELIQATGLGALAEKASNVRIVAPYGAAPLGRDANLSASTSALLALRRALPSRLGAEARSLRADRNPLRLIESGRRLKGNGDVLLPAVAIDPDAEGALLAASAAEGVPFVLLDAALAASWSGDSARLRREQLGAAPLTLSQAIATDASEDAANRSREVSSKAFDGPNGKSIVLVTNRTAWPSNARVTINTPRTVQGSPYGPGQSTTAPSATKQRFEAGVHALDLQLGPFETIQWRFSGDGVRVDGVRVDPQPEAPRELADALADLQSRNTTQRRPYANLLNASFEDYRSGANGGYQVSGWTLGEGASVDTTSAVDGAVSVRMAATGARPATLLSDPFTSPRTGQLVLSFRVLPMDLQPGSELQVDLEQVEGTYRNRATLTAAQLTRPTEAGGDASWLPPIVFPIDDLPMASRDPLRLRVTLVGNASLRLDDLRPEDLVLPLDGYGAIDLRTERFAIVRLLQTAQTLLDEGRLEGCRELLDSYWAQFLMDNFPRRADTVAADDDLKEAPTAEAETPSLSERFRGYLPRWWR